MEPDSCKPALLKLRVSAGELQRQRDFSLEGLGACIDELG